MSADTLGPVQLLVAGFDADAELKGEILAELERLSEQGILRVIDVIVVRKEEDGAITVIEADETGSITAVLTGLHGDDTDAAPDADYGAGDADIWFPADEIPPGTTAAVALIEHVWAIGLKRALQGTGGELLAEEWVHPLDLQAVGLG
jgi:hypothetical protein